MDLVLKTLAVATKCRQGNKKINKRERIGQGKRDSATEGKPRPLYRFFSGLDLPTCYDGDCSDRYDLDVFDDVGDDEDDVLAIVVCFLYHIDDQD